MSDDALGVVEVTGSGAAIVAADSLAKAAEVSIRRRIRVGGGLVAIVLTGDIASVAAAIDAAVATVGAAGHDAVGTVLGRPGPGIAALVVPPPDGSATGTAPGVETEAEAGAEAEPEARPAPAAASTSVARGDRGKAGAAGKRTSSRRRGARGRDES